MPRKILLVSALMVGASALTACSLSSDNVKVRPVDMTSLMSAPYDRFYEGAVSAINDRDYALALDYLQEARARTPRSAKVLNALGVVYDKLGRFDLSARYYAQAREIEPQSRIVAENIGYSRILQRFTQPETKLAAAPSSLTQTPVQSASAEPAAQPPTAAPTQPVVRTALNDVPVAPASVPFVQTEVRAVPVFATVSPVAAFAKLSPAALPESAPIKVTALGPVEPAAPVESVRLQRPASVSISAVAAQSAAKPVPDVEALTPAKAAVIRPVKLASLAAPAGRPAHIAASVQTGKRVLTIGQPLQVINASGQAARAGIVSQRLKVLGWTVRPSDLKQVRPQTALLYSPANLAAAQALQRTLPFPVRLTRGTGPAMQLVIGRDYVSWKPRNARIAALWQRGTVVASLQKPSTRGVR